MVRVETVSLTMSPDLSQVVLDELGCLAWAWRQGREVLGCWRGELREGQDFWRFGLGVVHVGCVVVVEEWGSGAASRCSRCRARSVSASTLAQMVA
jgi:hypothetical protein